MLFLLCLLTLIVTSLNVLIFFNIWYPLKWSSSDVGCFISVSKYPGRHRKNTRSYSAAMRRIKFGVPDMTMKSRVARGYTRPKDAIVSCDRGIATWHYIKAIVTVQILTPLLQVMNLTLNQYTSVRISVLLCNAHIGLWVVKTTTIISLVVIH